MAWLLRVVDGWPVFFRRRVVGPRGEFDGIKFRSMRRHANAMLDTDSRLKQAHSENFKLKSDPRVTKLGSFLRKYSLDELPQLFNVLCVWSSAYDKGSRTHKVWLVYQELADHEAGNHRSLAGTT
jgi:lipopolysaccharide/colanic/teichoic acid biosynthesis glycosyltransferase